MQNRQMTARGVRYSTDVREYPSKLSTNGRISTKAIAPNGHVISVIVLRSGRAYHTFTPKHGERKTVYMGGFLEAGAAGSVHFIPSKQEHVWMLYNWDREYVPSNHMPIEVDAPTAGVEVASAA